MRWLEVSARASHEAAETISAIFHKHGHGGVALVEPQGAPPTLPALVFTYIPLTPGWEATLRRLERDYWHLQAFDLSPMGDLQTRQVDEEDWANAWKAYFPVMRLGRRIVIKPSWHDYAAQGDDVVVEIDPGQAFGTGQHPSTALCLEALEDLPLPGAQVLDVGTGSGILALAAAGLGASRVVALDVDPVAVRVARENVARGPWAGAIEVREGTLATAVAPGERFAVCAANLIANLVVDLAPSLHVHLQAGGALVAGGILNERADEVAAALRAAGFATLQPREREGWTAILARR